MPRPSRLLLAGLLAILALASLGWFSLPGLAQLERWSYDARVRLSADGTLPSQQVAIIAIDDASLASLGRWPWPRTTLAELLQTLNQHYQVRASALDLVLAEAEQNPLRQNWSTLCQSLGAQCATQEQLLGDVLQPEQAFSRAVSGLPVIAGYYFTAQRQQQGRLPAPLPLNSQQVLPVPVAQGFTATHPQLASALPLAGFLNPDTDSDGIVRRIPLLMRYQTSYYPALAAQLALQQQNTSHAEQGRWLPAEEDLTLGVPLGGWRAPADHHGRALVPFYGPPGSIPTWSAAAVMTRQLPIEALRGKLVIVGATAPSLQDMRATPVSPIYPGVEAHASLALGLINQRLPYLPVWAPLLAALQIVLAGGLLLWRAGEGSRPAIAHGLPALLAGSVVALALWRWHSARQVLQLAAPLLGIALPYLLLTISERWRATRERRRLLNLFGEYVPPQVVERLQHSEHAGAMRAETRELSVLFADICDFTRIAEGLPPEELAALLNQYLDRQTAIIQQQQGTIDKYIGDAVMAFWGAPLSDAQHARHALHAALTMQDSLIELNREFAARGWPELAIGIGLHCGNMTVGNMGSAFRRAYTVLGDAVNLAARLESLTREYGVPLLCSSELLQAASWQGHWLEVDQVTVKGRQQPVTLCLPLSRQAPPTDWLTLRQAWHSGQFGLIPPLLDALAQQGLPPGLLASYARRLPAARTAQNWDGVWHWNHK